MRSNKVIPIPGTPLLIVVGALVLGWGTPVAAQVGKVAIIDVERVLLESKRGKSGLQEIDTLRQSKEAESKRMQEEISNLRQRLSEGSLSLPDDKIAELQKDMEAKVIALRRFQEDANAELTKLRNAVLQRIEKSVFPVINEIGKEDGYTLIFNKYNSGLIYADDAVDITDRVIQRYDQ